ncbi:MAG: hypothetical protein F4W93_06355 [Dehalococcoidia bacterium]|nr:hypothetical protein [Dehalococcoidia bacterium]
MTRIKPRLVKGSLQALAVLVFLYFLNATYQADFYNPLLLGVELTIGILWLILCYALSRTFGIVTILALSFAAYILWGVFIESVPTSDFLNIYKDAVSVSSGTFEQLFGGKSPTAIGYHALFHWLLGPTNLTNYIASSVAWTGGVAFTYKTLRYFVDDGQKVRFICAGLALCPTFMVFSPVVSSESVFFLLSAVCAWLISRHLTGRGPFPYLYIFLGIATAALFLTRGNGALGLTVCIFVIGAGWRWSSANAKEGAFPPASRSFRHALALCSIVFVSFFVVWFAHGYLSHLSGKGFQLSVTKWAGLNLPFGTNIEEGGRFNLADRDLVGYTGRMNADINRRALEIAIERIEKDPVGIISLALTDKVARLWDREHRLYIWAIGDVDLPYEHWRFFSVSPGLRFSMITEYIADESQPLKFRVGPLVLLSLDGVYRVTLLLFLLMLAREVRRPSILLALGLIVLLLWVPHILIEVRPRFHMAMTPFIVVGSMLFAYDLWDRRREWYGSIRRLQERWLGNRAK